MIGLGVFIMIHETLTLDDPSPYLITAAVGFLGLGPALRLDERKREKDNAAS